MGSEVVDATEMGGQLPIIIQMRLFASNTHSLLTQLEQLSKQLPQQPKSSQYTHDSYSTLITLLNRAFPSPALSSIRTYQSTSKTTEKDDFQRLLALFHPTSNFGYALLHFHDTRSPLHASIAPDQLAYLTSSSPLRLKRQNRAYTLPLLQLWAVTLALTFYQRERDVHCSWYEAIGVDQLALQLHSHPIPNLIKSWTAHLKSHSPLHFVPFLSALEAILLREPLAKLTANIKYWTLRPTHLMSAYLLGQDNGNQVSLEFVLGAGEWLEARERLNLQLLNLWVRVWTGMMTATSQWEIYVQTGLERAEKREGFSWRPSEMVSQLKVDRHWKRLFTSLLRLSFSLCRKIESTAHPELAATLSRLLLIETANSELQPNSPFATQLQDQLSHIKHTQAREVAVEAIRVYLESGGQLDERKERERMMGGQGLRTKSEVREQNEWAIPIRNDESPFLYVVGREVAKKVDWLRRSQGDGELPNTQMRWICRKRLYTWTIIVLLLLYYII